MSWKVPWQLAMLAHPCSQVTEPSCACAPCATTKLGNLSQSNGACQQQQQHCLGRPPPLPQRRGQLTRGQQQQQEQQRRHARLRQQGMRVVWCCVTGAWQLTRHLSLVRLLTGCLLKLRLACTS